MVAHLEEALARDARVGELGLRVLVADDGVVVTGCVSTIERHHAVVDVVNEVLPGHRVENRTTVPDCSERAEMESLP
ncbi:MAG: BON domain-containing protein [Actinomycetota bacterium]|nr:BON domain-containing protein [Actinomycetota bacterium]